MNLTKQIEEFKRTHIPDIPNETLKVMLSATKKLEQSSIADNALKRGDKMPPFTLPDAKGKLISSSELLESGPIVINFYRGGWCPYCNLEIRAFQKILPAIAQLGGKLVAISPNPPNKSLSTVKEKELTFDVLSDIGNKVAKTFGLVFALAEELRPIYKSFGIDLPAENGDDSYELPIPATYVVDSKGIIALSFVDADYTKRLEPQKTIKALEAIKNRFKDS